MERKKLKEPNEVNNKNLVEHVKKKLGWETLDIDGDFAREKYLNLILSLKMDYYDFHDALKKLAYEAKNRIFLKRNRPLLILIR